MGGTFRSLIATIVLAAAGAAWGEEPPMPSPEPAASDEAELARLENAFWACDYVATTQGIQATPAATCRYVTEQLKQVKFGGSFQQFLDWWRANKAAEHRRMARIVQD
jgi:hypothetical protein